MNQPPDRIRFDVSSVSSAIDFIAGEAPAWAVIKKRRTSSLKFTAQPERDGGTKTRLYVLYAEMNAKGDVSLRELMVGKLLPRFCPERHINSDSTFCLGLRAGSGIDSGEVAQKWWSKVWLFLSCQESAANTGRWPPHAQVSHGDAAEIQLAAEQLAETLGLRDEYANAVEFGSGRIAGDVVQFNAARNVLRNGPVSCTCERAGMCVECPNKSYECLIALEAKRRAAQEEFWRVHQGEPCCRTMHDCPLRNADVHGEQSGGKP
jgi:hypothetical protein